MNSFILFLSNLIGYLLLVTSKVIIIPDQILEDCVPKEQAANIFDYSELHLIPENDTHTFLHGKWKFIKPLKAPWKGTLTFERYERGQWFVQAIDRKYTDICGVLKNPMEPFYDVFKDVAGCPMKAGGFWEFNMTPITFNQMMLKSIPSYYMGRWRATFASEFEVDRKILKECRRAYGDMFEA